MGTIRFTRSNSYILKVVFVILTIHFIFGCGSNPTTNLPPNGTIESPANEVTVIAGGSVIFKGIGADPNDRAFLTYQWYFGGGAPNSTEKDPGMVTFNTPGTYTVTLTVTDSLGQSDPTPATVAVNVIYLFAATDELHGTELWVTDGSEAGTRIFKDINPGIAIAYPGSSYPSNFIYLNGTVFFFASDESHGNELWKSGGTKAGTVMVKDINPGYSSIDKPYNRPTTNLISMNGVLFFFATDGIHGTELWRSDGTEAGTTMIRDINPSGAAIDYHSNLATHNGILYFPANDGMHGFELWRSDGTEEGTVMVKDINPGISSSIPSDNVEADVVNVNGVLFFWADDGINGYELWKSNGTEAETVMVRDIYPGPTGSYPYSITPFGTPISSFAIVNGILFFLANDPVNGIELWKSDGTEAGTILVKDINPGNSSATGSCSSSLIEVNDTLFFTANDGTNGMELWKTDGTETGTMMVRDINMTSEPLDGSCPYNLINVSDVLFFRAFNGEKDGLWKSVGTETGTVSIKDFYAIWGVVPPEYQAGIMNVHGTLFFFASDGTKGIELWRSDGTETGTALVKDMDRMGSYPSNLTNVNGTLFFSAHDGLHGRELWKSDGTDTGTVMVKDIDPNVYFSVSNLVNVNGTLFFTANNGINSEEVWKSDGTEVGTDMIKDISPGGYSSNPENLINVDNTLFFTAYDKTNFSHGLWKSNGTELGTTLVKDIIGIENLTNVNGTLFFIRSREIWKSDGTSAGTVIVKDLSVEGGEYVRELTNVNGTLFFFTETSNGIELWKSDGTNDGTVIVKKLYTSGSSTSYPLRTVESGGTLFFVYNDGTHGSELWKSDGTETRTVMVKDINPGTGSSLINFRTDVNGTLFFVADDGENGLELWKSDGTEAGTVMVKDINQEGSSLINNLTNVHGTLFFVADDGVNGWELWKSDGTEAGTAMVKDINPDGNAFPSYIFWGQNFADVNGILFFFASDGINGIELWKSDGTEAFTVMVKDIIQNQN